ncbi:hypothetical protein BDK51DRAFT_26968 [Blyttiomyces helicus]|uniref:Uncharacterized protein n=1 Tax=Blyttiomyces helicus TaxID=388810 RepID=A0A4P9WBW6_9FUNG|nr:hypothetical protein BDK51DRAFT_26968 [Blyttiomyces helicus]|eukprot:RKO87806.1 hypothetical protein BDK51DRAFT_26968 [Blyttiomyces helicus]
MNVTLATFSLVAAAAASCTAGFSSLPPNTLLVSSFNSNLHNVADGISERLFSVETHAVLETETQKQVCFTTDSAKPCIIRSLIRDRYKPAFYSTFPNPTGAVGEPFDKCYSSGLIMVSRDASPCFSTRLADLWERARPNNDAEGPLLGLAQLAFTCRRPPKTVLAVQE